VKISGVVMVGILVTAGTAGTIYIKQGSETSDAEQSPLDRDELPVTQIKNTPSARSLSPKIKSTPSARSLSPGHRAALAFDFEGVSLADSLKEVQSRYPSIRYERKLSDKRIDKSVYYHADPRAAKAARYFFYKNRVYRVEIYFDYNEVQKSGGLNVVANGLIDRFGSKFEKVQNEGKAKNRLTMTWRFSEIDRDIEFSVINTQPEPSVHFSASDSKVMREIK
jgi:hypothetical protein